MGIVEGMHISIVEKEFEDLYNQWRYNKDGTARFYGGETKSEVRRRILQGLNFYADTTAHRNIAISSHGIAISQMMLYLGLECPDIPNGAILHLSQENGIWQYHELIH